MLIILSPCNAYYTAVSRASGYEVYRLARNIPKSQKGCREPNSLQLAPKYFLLSNQKTIMKRNTTFTKQKPKGTTFKVQDYSYSQSIMY